METENSDIFGTRNFRRYTGFWSLFSDTSKICAIDTIVGSEDAQGSLALVPHTHLIS